MAFDYAAAIYALDDSSLDVYQKAVWVRVLRRGVCYESQRSMAKSLGISLGKVNEALQWLLEHGWIARAVDENTQKLGYAAVLPDEQKDENVLPHEQPQQNLFYDMNSVLPHERHLKSFNTHTHTAREEMPEGTPPMHSGMAYEHPPSSASLEYQHQIDEMAAALSTVTGMNLELNKDRLSAEAISLLANNYTPEQVTSCFYGNSSYWRLMCIGGKKGDTPKFGNIRAEIANAVKWDGKVPASPNGNGRYPQQTDTAPPTARAPSQAEIDAIQALISKSSV